jgi:hypothetical protein
MQFVKSQPLLPAVCEVPNDKYKIHLNINTSGKSESTVKMEGEMVVNFRNTASGLKHYSANLPANRKLIHLHILWNLLIQLHTMMPI